MKKPILFLVALTGIVLSCEEQDKITPADEPNPAVRISPVVTKVTETSFESGDAIGLSINVAGVAYASNERLAYDGSVFSGDLDWYDSSMGESALLAYYPYSATAPTRFSVSVDLSAGLSASDFVAASLSGVTPSKEPVSMLFTHRMSRLEVTVANTSGKEFSGLKIGGVVADALLSASYEASADESASKTQIAPYPSGGKFYAIIPPQTAALKVSFTLGGEQKELELASAKFDMGKQNTVSIEIGVEAISVTLSGLIQNWENEDYSKRQILYTSTDGEIVTPYATDAFGANIVSNTYAEGVGGVITFDGDITEIGEKAFYKCLTLATITLPSGITAIKKQAFDSCKALTEVSLPAGLVSIGNYAFSSCNELKGITIPNGVQTIGYKAFCYCRALTGMINIPDSVVSIDEAVFGDCRNISGFSGKFATADGRALIAGDVFIAFVARGTTSLEIPSGIKRIGDYAFYYSMTVEHITIPEGVEKIGEDAFYAAIALKELTLPSTLTLFDYGAFWVMQSVSDLVFLSTTPPRNYQNDFLEGCDLLGRIIVPAGSVSAYKEAWPQYAGMIYGTDDPGFAQPSVPVAVDLGLSVKWASFNLGATTASGAGYFYAWGETAPKYNYSWGSYRWGNSTTSLTKYNSSDACGTVDGKTSLDAEDDAAAVNLGDGWHIPTVLQWDELRNRCSWVRATVDGVEGYTVTSKTNSNSIFLPVSGEMFGAELKYTDEGCYWTADLWPGTTEPWIASRFGISPSSISATHSSFGANRSTGLVIRPVKD